MIRTVALMSVLVMAVGACGGGGDSTSSADSVVAATSTSAEAVATPPPTVAVTTTMAAPTTLPPTTQPSTTVAETTTTVKTTGSKQAADCVLPLLFRDIDGDGFGVCYRSEDAPDAPPGAYIVQVPGTANIDSRPVDARNIVATVDFTECNGNGAAGTVVIEGTLTNNGSVIKRGAINMHLVDFDDNTAVVAARVADVPTGSQLTLDFQPNADGSGAAPLGDIALCYLDSINDITFFTSV